MDEKELTREEKIRTLEVFAGLPEELKRGIALGTVIGEYKARYGAAQAEAAAQTA